MWADSPVSTSSDACLNSGTCMMHPRGPLGREAARVLPIFKAQAHAAVMS
jgi:hypothetical protein